MFEGRRRLFVDLLCWRVPVVDSRFELDQCDGGATTATAVIECNSHVGSLALSPVVEGCGVDEPLLSRCRHVQTGPVT